MLPCFQFQGEGRGRGVNNWQLLAGVLCQPAAHCSQLRWVLEFAAGGFVFSLPPRIWVNLVHFSAAPRQKC